MVRFFREAPIYSAEVIEKERRDFEEAKAKSSHDRTMCFNSRTGHWISKEAKTVLTETSTCHSTLLDLASNGIVQTNTVNKETENPYKSKEIFEAFGYAPKQSAIASDTPGVSETVAPPTPVPSQSSLLHSVSQDSDSKKKNTDASLTNEEMSPPSCAQGSAANTFSSLNSAIYDEKSSVSWAQGSAAKPFHDAGGTNVNEFICNVDSTDDDHSFI